MTQNRILPSASLALMLMLCPRTPKLWAQSNGLRENTIATATAPIGEPHTADSPDLLRETQLGIRETGYAGLVWWIPFEFWQRTATERGVSSDQAEKNFAALRNYTIVGVFAAKIGAFGAMEFVPGTELRKNTFLRFAGEDYPVVQEPSQEAKNLSAILKPVLSAAMGKAGESFELLFFPAQSRADATIADAHEKGTFSVVLKNLVGVRESVYQWRLPLTSISAPKFCPAGKERVHANWEYCPWHGVSLNPTARNQSQK